MFATSVPHFRRCAMAFPRVFRAAADLSERPLFLCLARGGLRHRATLVDEVLRPARCPRPNPTLPTTSAPTTGRDAGWRRPFNSIWQNSTRNEDAGVVSRRRKEDLASFFHKRSIFLFRGFDPKP